MTNHSEYVDGVIEKVDTSIERRHTENMKAYYSKVLGEITADDLAKLQLKKQALVMSRDIIIEILKETL
jgi:hypothetical protein